MLTNALTGSINNDTNARRREQQKTFFKKKVLTLLKQFAKAMEQSKSVNQQKEI